MRDALFSGTGVSQYEVLSRERGQRVGSFGPRAVGLRKVRSTSCVLHSGNHSSNARKTHSRIIVDEADGTVVDVPIGCLNSVYPGRDEQRQARKEKLSVEKKAARDKKARLDARRREEGWDCGDIVTNDSDNSNQSEQEVESSSDDGSPSIMYTPGDEIITVTRMRGTVHAVNDDGTYHLVYKSRKRCGAIIREDKAVRSKYFSLASAHQDKPHNTPSSKRDSIPRWSYIEEPTKEWVDTGAVDSTSIITGKRTRSSVDYRL